MKGTPHRTDAGQSGPLVAAYLGLRDALAADRLGGGGLAVCHALSDCLDACLAEMAAAVPEVAVVAVGGYGRRELCLQSDVDVMLLHDGSLPDGAVQQILYPLWDANLAVGHSVRTPKEALAAAADAATLTALLDARLVAGRPDLLADLERRLGSRLRRRKLAVGPVLDAEERERRAAEPYPLQDADLKLGRGGLRALHALHWDRRAAALAGAEPDPLPAGLDEALEVLLATRNALHAAAGRAENRFVFGLRPAAAEWLGLETSATAHRLYRAMRVADGAARRRLGVALPDTAGLADVPGGRDGRWLAGERRALLDLAAAGAAGFEAFTEMAAAEWLDRALPEWRHVVAAPQLVPFHAHPVDAHLWRAAGEVAAITSPEGGEPWAPEVAEELGGIDDAVLAALLHDVGKGLGGDHSELGAGLAESACARLGITGARAARLVNAVRLHLLIPETATRRDVDDPVVIGQLADAVGDPATLRLLFLLAIADARATGPGMWTEWKAALVRTLFARVAAEFARRAAETGPTTARSRRLAELEVAALPRFGRATVRAHVRGMPAEYVDAFPVDAIVGHLELLERPPAGPEIVLAESSDGPIASATTVARDRPGLLATIAGVLALANVSVLDARLFTRADGLTVDTFRVEDALGGPLEPGRWDRVRRHLAAAAAGSLDLDALVTEKARAYQAEAPLAVRVDLDPAVSAVDTVVEIRCADHVGRLYRIGKVLWDLDLDVRLAKIDTRAGQVVDVFYVRHLDGTPLATGTERARLVEELSRRLGAPA